LLKLTNVIFSYSVLEKRFLGVGRVFLISFIIISIVNIYIRLVFRLSLELISFKIRIYFLIILFLLLSLITNLNYKFNVYDKIKNFKESWFLDVYALDKFIYWNIFFLYYNFLGC